MSTRRSRVMITSLVLALVPLCGAQTSVFTVLGNSSPYTDSTGQVWSASTGCSGGTSNSTTSSIIGSGADPTIYQHNLTSTSPFSCTYNVNQNVFYNVTLKFANITNLALNQFIFNVYINNTLVRNNLDIAALTSTQPGIAGTNRASDLGFTIPVGTVGQVSINLVPVVGGAMINAISITVTNSTNSISVNNCSVITPTLINVSCYNFASQSPGTSLIVGNTTITMTPVPLGVNGTDLYHRLYVSGGTGTAEACLITGGSGTSGQSSGTITLNCANTHSGAYTITSIDGGIQEASQAAFSAGGGYVFAPPATYTAFAATQIQSGVILAGVPGLTIIKAANQVLARNNQWLNAGAPASPGYYCMVCGAGSSSNIVIRDITVDENGLNQTYSYFSGTVELYNTTASRIEGVTVQNRQGSLASGGTGVGIGVYGTAANPPGSSQNNGIYASTVDAHPGGCTVPNGGGAFYIEGEGTRIDNSYAKDFCDVAFVAASCDHCVIANSVGDVGVGQMATPTFSVEGSTYTEFIGDQCIATGTNNGRYCVGIDSATTNGLTTQSAGTRVIGVSSSHHGTALEIGFLFSQFGVAQPVFDTDIIGLHGDTAANDCIVLSNYAIKVNITGGDLESCGGSGVSIISTGTGAGTTITNVVIDGLKSDHAVNAGVICNNSSGGSNPCAIGVKIVNSFLGDTNGTPRQLRGIWFQTPATDVYIAGNTTTGVTSNSYLFQGTLTNAFIGPNTAGDANNLISSVSLGSAVASAATITPTGQIFHVTGTTTISTINAVGGPGSSAGMSTCITMIPDGLWATNTTGDIALATTAVVNKALTECLDSSTAKWYPSY